MATLVFIVSLNAMPVKANVFSNETLVGTTILKVGDQSMGHVYGDLVPTDIYFRDIRKSVWEFWRTRRPDYKKWHSFRFNVQLENGFFLFPRGGITIGDLPELSNDSIRIDMAGVDSQVIQYFFFENVKSVLGEPWSLIDIKRKIGLENELFKEIGKVNRRFLGVLSLRKKHPLASFDFSALATYRCADEVLFAINKEGVVDNYAVIHLTWKSDRESEDYPGIEFYTDLDDFTIRRMLPDISKWEE